MTDSAVVMGARALPLNQEFQLMRAVGIFFVVLGHALGDFPGWTELEPLRVLIYSFHMHLFFFISGFFGAKFFVFDRGLFLAKTLGQAKRLLTVYCFCTLIIVLIRLSPLGAFSNRPLSLAEMALNFLVHPTANPLDTLWFIYTLFVMQVLFLAMHQIRRVDYRKPLQALLMLAALLVLHSFYPQVTACCGLKSLCMYGVFFFAGYVVSLHYQSWCQSISNYRYGAFILAPCYLFFDDLTGNSSHLLYGAVGIVLIWLTCCALCQCKDRIKRPLLTVGENSYAIYIYASFFELAIRAILVQKLHLENAAALVTITAIPLLAPMLLANCVLRPVPILRRVALGEWKSHKNP